jgi:tRNA A-37 threonylcarbamoyl transferase component Bud32
MGERFGDYEIEGRLGAGGMAEVYVARRAGPQGFVKRVCLKRVLAGNEADRDTVAQFHDEARLCAHLAHPGIATVHELGQVDGKWFMAMELVDGLDLRSLSASLRARGVPMPADVAIHVVRHVAEALAYAHALTIDGRAIGLVHRDVTPSNVLLSVHGEVKLADFGIARSSVRAHRTRSGVVKGKVPYMAPEQALGEPLDRRTDLFALGVVLYELLAGRRPHDGQTDLDTLTNAQRARRPSLRELAPEAPAEIVSLATRMLSARPDDRPASADEVARALAAVPSPRDVRRALAALVDDARRTRAGAPATRARGHRAKLRVDTPATQAEPIDEGPTEVGATAIEPANTDDSIAVRAPSRSRAIQFALGFGLTMVAGAILLCVLAIAFGGERISRAIADARASTTTTEIAASVEPPKQEPPIVPPVSTAIDTPPPPPVTETAHEHHAARRAPVTDARHDTSFGRIQVVAVPFGDVTLDGREIGRAPQTTTIEAGRHVVVVTNGGVSIERRVTVAPGGTAHVVIDMMDP